MAQRKRRRRDDMIPATTGGVDGPQIGAPRCTPWVVIEATKPGCCPACKYAITPRSKGRRGNPDKPGDRITNYNGRWYHERCVPRYEGEGGQPFQTRATVVPPPQFPPPGPGGLLPFQPTPTPPALPTQPPVQQISYAPPAAQIPMYPPYPPYPPQANLQCPPVNVTIGGRGGGGGSDEVKIIDEGPSPPRKRPVIVSKGPASSRPKKKDEPTLGGSEVVKEVETRAELTMPSVTTQKADEALKAAAEAMDAVDSAKAKIRRAEMKIANVVCGQCGDAVMVAGQDFLACSQCHTQGHTSCQYHINCIDEWEQEHGMEGARVCPVCHSPLLIQGLEER